MIDMHGLSKVYIVKVTRVREHGPELNGLYYSRGAHGGLGMRRQATSFRTPIEAAVAMADWHSCSVEEVTAS